MSKREIGYWVVTMSLLLFGVLYGAVAYADIQRRGDKLTPPITWEKAPGDYTDISWAATPVPVDGVDAVALASPVPERALMANVLLGNLMSDPTWRAWVSTMYRRQLEVIDADGNPTDEERAEASKWARDHAVLVPLAFIDALLAAAGE